MARAGTAASTGGFRLDPMLLLGAGVIFLMADPFAMQLAGIDPAGPVGQTGKPYPTYLHYLVVAGAGYLAFDAKKLDAVVRVVFSAPLLAIFGFYALFSAAWSPAPYLAVRDAIAFIGTIFALGCVIVLLRRQDSFRALMLAMGLSVVLSVVWALFVPHYGLHAKDDIFQASHVGKWRGIYRHKNILGQVSGMTAGALLAYGYRLIPRTYWIPILVACVACLAFSQSASGLLLAIGGAGFGAALFRLQGNARIFAFLVAAVLSVFLAAVGADLLSFVLVALGKNPTFSGRTFLWEAATKLISERWILGYGLSSINDESVTKVFTAVNADVRDPHNSYFQVMIALGVVGLALHLGAIGFAAFRGWIPTLRGSEANCRRALTVMLILWLIAALVEAAPFIPGNAVNPFGLFAVLWLSSAPMYPQARSGGRERTERGLQVESTAPRRERSKAAPAVIDLSAEGSDPEAKRAREETPKS